MPSLPPPPSPGDPIYARDFAALVEAVRRTLNISSGAGLAVQQSTGGLSVSLLANLSKYVLEAIITHAPDSEDVPIEEAIYSARPVGQSDGEITESVPVYGRLFGSGVRVRPAKVGDLCAIVRMPIVREERPVGNTADLWILSEQVLVRRCGTTPPPGGGGGSEPGTPPGEPPPPPPPPGSTPGEPNSAPIGGGEQ